MALWEYPGNVPSVTGFYLPGFTCWLKGAEVGDTDTTSISQGQWLGIDVGSNRDKVFNFCLIKSDGKGQVDVLFEVGKARGPFPSSKAGVFEDLGRATWL
jgi:hypothetical protein